MIIHRLQLLRLRRVALRVLLGLGSLIIFAGSGHAQPAGKEFVYRKSGERQLRLYAMFPKDWQADDRRPAIVFFHHGSWIVGTPTQFNEHAKYLAGRGMVAFQVEYRLLDRNSKEPPIACIEDANSSMRWLRANAGKLGIDPERLASAGGSAGGHLAAFVGMMNGFDAPGDDLKISPRANAMVLYDPAFDNGPGKWGHERVKDRYKEFSPYYSVAPKLPPSIIIVGEKDGICRPKSVADFAEAMKKAGNRCDAIIYPGKPHDFHNWRPGTPNLDYYDTLERVDRFLVSLGWLVGEEPPRALKNSIDLELVLIPAGEFDIGTPDSAKYNPWPSEQPQHRVKITKAFYLGKFEVTQEQYEKVMGKNPSYFSKTGDYKDKVRDLDTSQFPVEGVPWDDTQAFCAKLSNREAEKKAGRTYRLPTSAEWEYACRAGTTTLFYSGDTVSFKEANFGDGGGRPDVGMFGRGGNEKTKPPGRTTKVGSYAPNAWGLYDMHGNVVEWCQDYFDPDYYKLKVKEDPQGPKIGFAFAPQARVVRGGSWWTRTNYNRSACRHPSGQVGGPGRVGFRVVCAAAAGTP